MVVIGDVHGKYDSYRKVLEHFAGEYTLQLGDMGVGFPKSTREPEFGEKDFFFRGNHDNTAVARANPNYLGEGGIRKLGGIEFFYVPGAWSIDQKIRKSAEWTGKHGQTWWEDEQLSVEHLENLVSLYSFAHPSIVITHDAPVTVSEKVLNYHTIPSSAYKPKPVFATRTSNALQRMFEIHQPDFWIFGHYHVDWTETIKGTRFQCLNELSFIEIK